MNTRLAYLLFLIFAVLGQYATAQDNGPEAEMLLEQQRLSELLRNAPPATMPDLDEFPNFSQETALQSGHHNAVVLDRATGEVTVESGLSADDDIQLSPSAATPFIERKPSIAEPPFGEGALPPSGDETKEGRDNSESVNREANNEYNAIASSPLQPILNPRNTPFKTIYKLLMCQNGTTNCHVCSGFAFDEFHVITAGHCVYDPTLNDWVDTIWLWAAQNDKVDPFNNQEGVWSIDHPYGEADWERIRTSTGWLNGDINFDWALITINRKQGPHTGWMGLQSSVATSLNYSGYPTESGNQLCNFVNSYPDSLVQWHGFDDNNVTGSDINRISLDAIICGGHSGGPSWRFDGTDRWSQGIHSTSNRNGNATETRLNSALISNFQTWIAEDKVSMQPIARPDIQEHLIDANDPDKKNLYTNEVQQGEDIEFEFSVLNSGNADAGRVDVAFYLSTNRFISNTDLPLSCNASWNSFAGWTSWIGDWSCLVPTSIPPGTYYLGWIYTSEKTEYPHRFAGNNMAVIGDETVTIRKASPTLFRLTTQAIGSGTVTSSPAGINCGSDCTQDYNKDTMVTLTSTPAQGWSFTGWSGACSGTGSCIVNMNANKSVTASFTEVEACTLGVELKYASGNLTLGLEVGTAQPATWGLWLIIQGNIIPVIQVSLPAIDPPLKFNPTFPFPKLGFVDAYTALIAPGGKIICEDVDRIDTGGSTSAQAKKTEEALQKLRGDTARKK